MGGLSDTLDTLTDIPVDGVDSLDVTGHGLDAGLFTAHFVEKQVIGLQVEHARDLARIHRGPPALPPLVVMTVPAGIERLVDLGVTVTLAIG